MGPLPKKSYHAWRGEGCLPTGQIQMCLILVADTQLYKRLCPLGCESPDLECERPDLRSEMPDLRSERPALGS